MATLLKANEVAKIYAKGQRPSLNKVSFNVAESEFIAIMGASGSGKTTLLNVLSTIDTPTSGSIVINGVNLKQLSDTGPRISAGIILDLYFRNTFYLTALPSEKTSLFHSLCKNFPIKKSKKWCRV